MWVRPQPCYTDRTFLRDHLGRLIEQVEQRGDRIIIRKRSRKVAAIVSMGDFRALDEADSKELGYKEWQTMEAQIKWAAMKRVLHEEQQKRERGK